MASGANGMRHVGFAILLLLLHLPNRGDAAVLLQTTLDNATAITSPSIGVAGSTTLLATDFVAGQAGNAARFSSAGKVARFPAANGTLQNIETDRGEIEL